MIDEELYVLATQELNSDRRRTDLWDRAIALASDDHDEARYLYTNLRVEELVEERKAEEKRKQNEADSVDETPEPTSEPGTPKMSEESLSDDNLGFEEMNPITKPAAPDVSWMNLNETTDEASGAGGTPFPPTSVGADDTQDLEEKKSVRISNQTNFFIENGDKTAAEELDPLERTEPEGFNMADDSMELTAPDELPPVTLNPDFTGATDLQSGSSLDAGHLESTQDIGDDTFDAEATGNFEGIPQDISQDISQDQSQTAESGNPEVAAAASIAGTAPGTDLGTALRSGPAYRVLEHRDGSRAAVKMGKSLPAMLLTLPWLLYKRLWGTAIVYLLMAAVLLFALLSTGLGLLDAGSDAGLPQKLVFGAFALLALVGLVYVPWSQGNSWIAARLMRQGYSPKTAVNAQTARDALDIAR